MRHFVIGDIHGHATALSALLEIFIPCRDDIVTFLGDLVDHGPASARVLDTLADLSATSDVRVIKGNHEELLLASVEDPTIEPYWHRYGGEATLKSIGVAQAREIPDRYIEQINNFHPWIEDSGHIFVHAGADRDLAMADQSEDSLFWKHISSPIAHESGKVLVTGHTMRIEPVITKGFIGLDTGIASGGWLSCLELNSNTLYQVDALGHDKTTRNNHLKAA